LARGRIAAKEKHTGLCSCLNSPPNRSGRLFSLGRPKDYPLGTLGYVDKTLVYCTPKNPQGVPYSPEDLKRLRKQFIASRMRMFEDVVYGQFGYLNRPRKQVNGEPHGGYPESVRPKR